MAGWAAATHSTRRRPDEAAEIATRWTPGLDGPVARRVIRHMQYRPRITAATLKAFDDAVELLLEQQKLRTRVTSQSCDGRFIREVMGEHPELFADLPPAC